MKMGCQPANPGCNLHGGPRSPGAIIHLQFNLSNEAQRKLKRKEGRRGGNKGEKGLEGGEKLGFPPPLSLVPWGQFGTGAAALAVAGSGLQTRGDPDPAGEGGPSWGGADPNPTLGAQADRACGGEGT